MLRIHTIISLIGLTVVACTTVPQDSMAGEQPNILIMTDDSDQDSIERGNPVYVNVLDEMEEQFRDMGFRVYNEIAITRGTMNQERTSRTQAELLDIAQGVKTPIDAAVIFTLIPVIENKGYTNKVSLSLMARTINAKNGESLGSAEVHSRNAVNIDDACWNNGPCARNKFAPHARRLAADMGYKLARKLDYLSPSSRRAIKDRNQSGGLNEAYTITLKQFDRRDVNDIEEYLAAFRGYLHHRIVKSDSRYVEIWYETDSDISRLTRNLRKMLTRMGIDGDIDFDGKRNAIFVERLTHSRTR